MSDQTDAQRLETLWAGAFGDEYVERNRDAVTSREPLWRRLHAAYPFASVLEVGCNLGANLHWLAQLLDPRDVWGVDVNAAALREARARLPDVNLAYAPARSLPFRDAHFELTFTTGVLIHQPPEALPVVMGELVRCARRYVLCGEYHAEHPTEVPYRGQRGALYKRDWGSLYGELFPALRLREQWFEARDAGWDDVTFWLFEKTPERGE